MARFVKRDFKNTLRKKAARFPKPLIILTACFAAIFIVYIGFMGGTGAGENPVVKIPAVSKPAPPHHVTPKPIEIQGRFQRGDTIINALKRQGISHDHAYAFFNGVKPVYDLRRICAGKKFTLLLTAEAGERTIQRFKYVIDEDQYLEVKRNRGTGAYDTGLVDIPYVTKEEFIKGEITLSLFSSIMNMGEKPELADIMASLYDYDIDFNRDLRQGDEFGLLVEKKYLEGRFVRYGNVLASSFTNKGKTIRIIRYTDPEGKTAYYHPDGRSVRKMFLRCPLPFMRVTSRYGNRRHPVKGFTARHLGVDLAAPTGTKVRSTSGGIVQTMAYNNIKGRHIHIRHKNGFVTHYYHLSRFKKGLKRGQRVEQGEVIGYVGTTGWSTGPHLHYGVLKYRRFLNPLSLKSPTKEPVKKVYLPSFRQYARHVFLLMSGSDYINIPERLTKAVVKSTTTHTPTKPGGLSL